MGGRDMLARQLSAKADHPVEIASAITDVNVNLAFPMAAGHSIFQGQVVHRGPLIASPTLRAALAACPEPGGQDG